MLKHTFKNPLLPGFYPDPSICRVGEDYYMVTSSFVYYPGLPIFHSKDLVHWEQIGHGIHRPDQLDYKNCETSLGLWAPSIRYHEGTFFVFIPLVDEGILVASKIADRVGITRSVIVNALRKFESAGIIESRSSGMKGTYIKVCNEFAYGEIRKMKEKK